MLKVSGLNIHAKQIQIQLLIYLKYLNGSKHIVVSCWYS